MSQTCLSGIVHNEAPLRLKKQLYAAHALAGLRPARRSPRGRHTKDFRTGPPFALLAFLPKYDSPCHTEHRVKI